MQWLSSVSHRLKWPLCELIGDNDYLKGSVVTFYACYFHYSLQIEAAEIKRVVCLFDLQLSASKAGNMTVKLFQQYKSAQTVVRKKYCFKINNQSLNVLWLWRFKNRCRFLLLFY